MLKSAITGLLATTVLATLPAQDCFSLMIGTDLALNDDDTAQGLPLGFSFNFGGVAYTDICVSSNGFIWFGPTSVGGSDYTPTEAELLAGAARICPLWCDFNPAAAGSGHIYYDNSIPGIATITWAGVFEFGGTNPVEMQVVLDAASNITVTYGINPAIGGTLSPNAIIGATTGGGASANLISFATRPITQTVDTFYEVIPTNGTPPIAYPNVQMAWIASNPGYIISDTTCTMNTLPSPASSQIVGAGCPDRQGPALYELFDATNNVPDLSGLDQTFLPTGGGDFIVLPGLSPTYFAGYANSLALGDDQTILVTLPFAFPYDGGVINDIYVSSNGFITLGPTDPGSGCCNGNAAALLAGEPRIAAWWGDLNPNSGGAIYADLDPGTGEFVISWDQVPEYNTNPPQTAQIALSPAGDFTIRWGNVSTATHTFLAGYSGGNGSPDPGSANLSAVNGTTVTSSIIVPLEHDATAGSSPQVGGSFSVDGLNVPPAPNGNVVLLLVSTEIPGIPLDALGMIGCTAYLALPEIYSAVNVTLGAPTTSFVVPIPFSPVLFGGQLMSQVVSDDLTANPFGFIASNGLRWTLGL